MPNQNNCGTCEHKQRPDGGHCYMFRDEPSSRCMQHTGYTELRTIVEQIMKGAAFHELNLNRESFDETK